MALTGDYLPSPSDHARRQAEAYEASGGTEADTLAGVPIVVLTTIGARSGALRKTPLMRVEHEGAYAVIASQGGAPTHPSWFHNLTANPLVELQDGAERRRHRARVATGEERERWWARAVAVWPDYEGYQTRTEREIPVVALDPV